MDTRFAILLLVILACGCDRSPATTAVPVRPEPSGPEWFAADVTTSASTSASPGGADRQVFHAPGYGLRRRPPRYR